MPETAVPPLAYRMRPQTLGEFSGQEHVVGEGTALRRAIEQDALRSVILAGPPGTGKTTLAHVIANATRAQFVQLNAVLSGVKDLRAVCTEAEQVRTNLQQRTVLFIDEIHRFNTAQQDALLPYVESGVVILIGATTENPYFAVNGALVSRSHVCLLQPLAEEHIIAILRRATDDARGFGGKIAIHDDVLAHIARISNGDARIALNCLELAVMVRSGKGALTLPEAQDLLRERAKRYDATKEDHYDSASAFIKTLRGSDADAALVWMFRMLEGGEQPRFLFRRMAIFASEDIGNADPQALQFVVSAWQAFEMVGLPEGEYFLSHACIYLAQAPKSNAVKNAMGGVRRFLKETPLIEVPMHLRNAPAKGMAQQGYGEGYVYPHDHPGGVVPGHYFPAGIRPQTFYRPTDRGFEADIRSRMETAKTVIRSAPVAQSPRPVPGDVAER